MFSISNLFTKNKKQDDYSAFFESQAVHPPKDVLIPRIPVSALLDKEHENIHRIKFRFAHNAEYFNRYMSPILELAVRYYHLLPASQSYHHYRLGGLLNHCLEVGGILLQTCQAHDRVLNLEDSQSLNDMYIQIVTFFLGIFHDIGKVRSMFSVRSGEHEWNPHQEPLLDWLMRNELTHYTIQKLSEVENHDLCTQNWVGALIQKLPCTLPPKVIDAIYYVSSQKSHTLNLSIAEADNQSVRNDVISYGSVGDVNSKRQILIEAIVDYLKTTSINSQPFPVLYTDEGLYLTREKGVRSLIKFLRDFKVPWLKPTYNTLPFTLKQHNLILPSTIDEDSLIHDITHNAHGKESTERAFKLNGLFEQRLDLDETPRIMLFKNNDNGVDFNAIHAEVADSKASIQNALNELDEREDASGSEPIVEKKEEPTSQTTLSEKEFRDWLMSNLNRWHNRFNYSTIRGKNGILVKPEFLEAKLCKHFELSGEQAKEYIFNSKFIQKLSSEEVFIEN